MAKTSLYNLSRDYQKLYQLICDGHTAAGFVDFCFMGDEHIYRDICQIKKEEPYRIFISCRGTLYGGIYPFMSDKGAEEELFIRDCEGANLEWIEPCAGLATHSRSPR